MSLRRYRWWAGHLLFVIAVGAAAAEPQLGPLTTACNDLNNPGRSPDQGFEMFFDVEVPKDARPENWQALFEGPALTADRGRPDLPKVPIALLDPARYTHKSLSLLGGAIYFYEPDGNGGRRLCRIEDWVSRKWTVVRGEKRIDLRKTYDYKTAITTPYLAGPPPQSLQTHNPVLAQLAKEYLPIKATRYRYDVAGRLVEIASFNEEVGYASTELEDKDAGALARWNASGRGACRLYRADGKLWRYAAGEGRFKTDDCLKPSNEKTDYFEFRYAGNGDLAITIQNIVGKNGWLQIWDMNVEGRHVEAEVDDRQGVRYVAGAVSLVAPRDNGALKANGGVYFFPNRDVPSSVLEDFSKIYAYQRVREFGGNIARMLEAFPAGSSQLQTRVWLNTANNTLLREEQYKNGKLVRVINTDFAHEPVDYYVEHLDRYVIRPQNLVQRVYEFDDKGNERLVAVSWTNVAKKDYYEKSSAMSGTSSGRHGKQVPERLEFYYGLPDGTVKWKTFEEFQKAFNIHENADWLYPKGAPERF